jgi:release factor glutamine methyltransferase
MLPTPDLSHLTRSDYQHIYEPAGKLKLSIWATTTLTITEDTFILLDALEADQRFLKARNPTLCLEVGCVRFNGSRNPVVTDLS